MLNSEELRGDLAPFRFDEAPLFKPAPDHFVRPITPPAQLPSLVVDIQFYPERSL